MDTDPDENEKYYYYGDSVDYQYDTKKLKKEISVIIYDWILDLPKNQWENEASFYSSSLLLRKIYEFSDLPDFVLMQYEIDAFFPVQIHIGYIKSAGNWYCLSEGYDGQLVDNFNSMIRENEMFTKSNKMCLAALFIKLHINYFSFVILNSTDDIIHAAMFLEEFDLPDSLHIKQCFYSNINSNSKLMNYISDLKPDSILPLYYEKKDIFEISQIKPPYFDITQNTVTLSTYNYLDAETANWSFEFGADNTIKDLVKKKAEHRYRFENSLSFFMPLIRADDIDHRQKEYFYSLQEDLASKRTDTTLTLNDYSPVFNVKIDYDDYTFMTDIATSSKLLEAYLPDNIAEFKALIRADVDNALFSWIDLGSFIETIDDKPSAKKEISNAIILGIVETGRVSVYDNITGKYLKTLRMKPCSTPTILGSGVGGESLHDPNGKEILRYYHIFFD